MSNVRLSNGSPTLERTEPRPTDQPQPSACRSLFGPVDHDELKRDYQRQLKAMEDASADEWNFDFSAHTPRPGGRFQWEALDIRDVPGFYSRSARGSLVPGDTAGDNDNNVDLNGNHDCRLTEQQDPETPGTPRKRPSRPDSSCHSKRLCISDNTVTRLPRKPQKPRRPPTPT